MQPTMDSLRRLRHAGRTPAKFMLFSLHGFGAWLIVLLSAMISLTPVATAGEVAPKASEMGAPGNPWADFNPGSWVEIKSTTVRKSDGTEKTTVVGTRITLLEKTADHLSLENEMTIRGQSTRNRFDVPLGEATEPPPEDLADLRTGTETVTIAGKPVTCETREGTMDLGGSRVHVKKWTSAQVPGFLVKSVTSGEKSQSTAEVVDFGSL